MQQWAGAAIIEEIACTEAQAATILQAWKKHEVIREGEYINNKLGKKLPGCVRVNPAKADLMRRDPEPEGEPYGA